MRRAHHRYSGYGSWWHAAGRVRARPLRPANTLATRRVVGRIAVVFVLGLVLFALFTRLVPLTGSHLYIVGGGSMEPAIPVGALVIATPADPARIAIGDVVTVRGQDGVVITHRVSRVVDGPAGRSFELKGDANPTPDAALVSAGAVVGTVDRSVPLAGYVQAFLSTSTGMVSALALLVALLLAYLSLEMLERLARQTPVSAPGVVGR